MRTSPPGSTCVTDEAVARIDPLWRSWAGAHGGHVAAAALTAIRERAVGQGRPLRALTAHFLAPVDTRPLRLSLTGPRAGRRASTCLFTAHQGGAVVLAGSALFGSGHPGPSHDGRAFPQVPGPADCVPLDLPAGLVAFARQVEVRPATETLPLAGGELAELLAWVRFTDGRPLDEAAVVTLTDVLPPALFARWRTPRPVPTAELTLHFADTLDAGALADWALVRIRTEQADSGWAVDDSEGWSADGRMLALARQARVVQDAPAEDASSPSATAALQETS
ncbi:thioesterase family protein [Streptomyces sp. NPDC004728]|uniref:acyl-CoA thioesterase n=1 Tax=Streptomyces sp. NPDC004728 TaxID=3154289 RepID=UPI0033B70A04